MKKTLSIITPSYNSENTLMECIDSVKSQNYKNFEHLVIDGLSKDNTLDLLKSYKEYKNLKWISEKDSGISDAMNKGFNLAKGEILAWLDADNYYEKNIFEKIISIFEKTNVDIIYGNIKIVNQKGELIREHKPQKNISIKTAIKQNTGGIPLQPGVFFKKNLITDLGGFDTNYKIAGDMDFWLKILKSKPNLLYIDEPLGYYRLEDRAASQSMSGIINGLKEMINIEKNYGQNILYRILMIKKYVYGYARILIKRIYENNKKNI